MRGVIQLARIAGIPVRLHWTFVFLVLWIGYVSFKEMLSLQETLFFFLLVACLFVCVVAHEYGHALTAKRYHVPTRDILILPIGGLARLEYLPPEPRKEIIIAIAGPLVNVFIAILLALVVLVVDGWDGWSSIVVFQDLLSPMGLIYAVLILNITLFFFNLIPAYPMDGGRILRSLFSLRWGRKKATIYASYLAQFIGLGFFAMSLWGEHFTLALIGVFIFFTARWERRSLTLSPKDSEE